MQSLIEQEIYRKCKSLLKDSDLSNYYSQRYREKYIKRTGLASPKTKMRFPWYWDTHPAFDPRYCISRSAFLAKVAWHKITNNGYAPLPAIAVKIPKDNGEFRDIMIFSIVDTAVANVFHKILTKKNKNLFSPYSFAFNPDKSVFDAIIQIKSFISDDKLYTVQYDFSKYFDTISHSYIRYILREKDYFITTSLEKNIIDKYCEHQFLTYPLNYPRRSGPPSLGRKSVGVPQGCSLSLFLSNIAAHELDKRLEQRNGQFVRFADDVLCVTRHHDDALTIADEFLSHCTKSGVRINFEKSPGIERFDKKIPSYVRSFFTNNGEGHTINTINSFAYLGHNISSNKISLTDKAVRRIKRRISRIVYIHLLMYIKQGSFSRSRVNVSAFDWDLVTCLNEIRKYVYGKLKHDALLAFIEQNRKIKEVQGLMAFYVLLSDVKQLAELDGWLLDIVQRALRKRKKILGGMGVNYTLLAKDALVDGSWYRAPERNEAIMPSFVLAWRCARKFMLRYGIAAIKAPDYYSTISLY